MKWIAILVAATLSLTGCSGCDDSKPTVPVTAPTSGSTTGGSTAEKAGTSDGATSGDSGRESEAAVIEETGSEMTEPAQASTPRETFNVLAEDLKQALNSASNREALMYTFAGRLNESSLRGLGLTETQISKCIQLVQSEEVILSENRLSMTIPPRGNKGGVSISTPLK